MINRDEDFNKPGPVVAIFWPQLKAFSEPLTVNDSVDEQVADVNDRVGIVSLVGPIE